MVGDYDVVGRRTKQRAPRTRPLAVVVLATVAVLVPCGAGAQEGLSVEDLRQMSIDELTELAASSGVPSTSGFA